MNRNQATRNCVRERRLQRTSRCTWVSICAILSLTLLFSTSAFAQTKRLVLVTGNQSTIPELTLNQVRRIYLGHALRGTAITPLSNQSDDLLFEVFLQKVIFLSERDYEKRLITRTFQTGDRRPSVHLKERDLLQSLERQTGSVTFMWEETASRHPQLRVVKVLWSE